MAGSSQFKVDQAISTVSAWIEKRMREKQQTTNEGYKEGYDEGYQGGFRAGRASWREEEGLKRIAQGGRKEMAERTQSHDEAESSEGEDEKSTRVPGKPSSARPGCTLASEKTKQRKNNRQALRDPDQTQSFNEVEELSAGEIEEKVEDLSTEEAEELSVEEVGELSVEGFENSDGESSKLASNRSRETLESESTTQHKKRKNNHQPSRELEDTKSLDEAQSSAEESEKSNSESESDAGKVDAGNVDKSEKPQIKRALRSADEIVFRHRKKPGQLKVDIQALREPEETQSLDELESGTGNVRNLDTTRVKITLNDPGPCLRIKTPEPEPPKNKRKPSSPSKKGSKSGTQGGELYDILARKEPLPRRYFKKGTH